GAMLRTKVTASRQSPPWRSVAAARRRIERISLRTENDASRSRAPLSPSHGACLKAVCEGGRSPCLEIAWIVTLSLQFTEVAATTSAMVRLVPMTSIVSPGRQEDGAVHGSCDYREEPSSPSRAGGEPGAGLPTASTTSSAVIVDPSVACR